MNLVDPDGMQWYSYTDENGYTKYEYREGEMSDEDKAKYKDLKDLGYFFFDYKNHVYHSLFGKEVNWGEKDNDWSIVELCNKVDRLIIDYAKDAYDTWSGSDRVNMHIDGWPLGKYTFVHNGLTFTTKKGDFEGGVTYLNGNLLWNAKRENAWSLIQSLPTKPTNNENGSGAHYHDFWVYAVNPDKGAGKGARTLQLRFDRDNYRRFLSSYGKIFGAKNSK